MPEYTIELIAVGCGDLFILLIMTVAQKYKQVREDFEELETLAELNDWMSIEENMVSLMRNPSKARAADLYDSAISLWFREHGVTEDTADIAERYNIR